MSTAPPIPTHPPPDKDPPSQTSSSSSPTPTPQPQPPQRTSSEIPPSHTPQTSHSLSTGETPAQQQPSPRPSPLRQNTADSQQQQQQAAPSLTLPSTSTVTPAPLSTTSRPPTFHSFFTLINDPGTGTTHHPRQIHYLFSDDDESEILTSACLRSLHPTTSNNSNSNTSSPSTSQKLPSSFTSSSSSTAAAIAAAATRREAQAPAPAPVPSQQREERVILVDMNTTGDAIQQIHSLSANWQVLSASLEKAPTWAGGDEEVMGEGGDREGGGGGGGLMLRIEGVGMDGKSGDDGLGIGIMRGSASAAVLSEEEMQSLLEGFDRKMGMLRKIVGAGEQFMARAGEKEESGKEKGEKEEETGKEE